MRIATMKDHANIMALFYMWRDVFPHVRSDYLQRMIRKGTVVWTKGVVITFTIYKRKQPIGLDGIVASKGDCMLHQIASECRGKGYAAEVFKLFLRYVDTNVYLTVRENNHRAVKFYYDMGMEELGEVYWAAGTIPGLIFVSRKEFIV